MEDYRTVILGKAFAAGPGVEYNDTSYGLREEHDWLFYEVVLAEGQSWAEVREQIFPPLGRFLGFKKLAHSFGAGLVISLFHGDHFYLITGPDFLGAYCELEDLDRDALSRQIRQWITDEPPVFPLMRG
jgi:hypothetical protein